MNRQSAVVATIALAVLLAAGCLVGQDAEPEGAPPGPEPEDAGDDNMPAENANDDPVLDALIERREELMAALREEHPLTEQEENAYREMIAEYVIRRPTVAERERNVEISRHIHRDWQEALPILNDMIRDLVNQDRDDTERELQRVLSLLPYTSAYERGGLDRKAERACVNELVALIGLPHAFHPVRVLRGHAVARSLDLLAFSRHLECDCLAPSLRSELQSRARDVIDRLTEDEDARVSEQARQAQYRLGIAPRPPDAEMW